MAIALVTGVPGAGKTLYTLAKLVPSLTAETVGPEGTTKRRLLVGGVRDLMIEHEVIEVPKILDWDQYKDQWSSMVRDPGEPPLDVPCRADNWWLWCLPGDVIVIDEAQSMFRTAASGRKTPRFISALETHRHYGVDFVLITQGPNLLHSNVRSLVGRHLHVRPMWGSHTTLVYEWDRCANPSATKSAQSSTPWRHDKSAYGLYKSAEVHTKRHGRIPIPAVLLVAALVATPYLAWRALNRSFGGAESQAASAPASSVIPPGPMTQNGLVFIPAFEPQRGQPGFVDALPPRRSWPHNLAGCWLQGDECSCAVNDGAYRVVSDRRALCLAVVGGDLVPPASHPRPERIEPVAASDRAASGSGV